MTEKKNKTESLVKDKKPETHFTPGAIKEMCQDEITNVLEKAREGQNLKLTYKLLKVEVLGSTELKVMRKERSSPAGCLKKVLFERNVVLSRDCSSSPTNFFDWESSIYKIKRGKVFNVEMVK